MHASTAVRIWPPAAVRAGFIALAAALMLAAAPVLMWGMLVYAARLE